MCCGAQQKNNPLLIFIVLTYKPSVRRNSTVFPLVVTSIHTHLGTLSAYPRVQTGRALCALTRQLHTSTIAAFLTLYKPLWALASLFQEPKTWLLVSIRTRQEFLPQVTAAEVMVLELAGQGKQGPFPGKGLNVPAAQAVQSPAPAAVHVPPYPAAHTETGNTATFHSFLSVQWSSLNVNDIFQAIRKN